MRLQYFGSSTQEGQFAAMLSDRALGIMEMRSQVNQDEMCSSNSSNSDNTSPQFLWVEGSDNCKYIRAQRLCHSSDNI